MSVYHTMEAPCILAVTAFLLCATFLTSSLASDVIRRKRADDADLELLRTLVQQQVSTIQQLQSDVTALKAAQPASFAEGTSVASTADRCVLATVIKARDVSDNLKDLRTFTNLKRRFLRVRH